MHSCVLLHALCWMVFLASAALLAGAPHSTHVMHKHKQMHMHIHVVSSNTPLQLCKRTLSALLLDRTGMPSLMTVGDAFFR